jgi:hypothetical protein
MGLMADDPAWDSVWQAAAATDRSGALWLVGLAIALVLVLAAAAVWARWHSARRPATRPARTEGAKADAGVADPLTPLGS